jgi:hypothetical protein
MTGQSSGHEPASTPDQRHDPVHDMTGNLVKLLVERVELEPTTGGL